MSPNIVREVMLLVHSFLLGIVLTVIYDGMIVLRKLFHHFDVLISLEDLLFWIGCAVSVFYMLYEENNGILRWFAVAGVGGGMLVYKVTFSSLVVKAAVKVLGGILGLLRRLLLILTRPAVLAGRKIRKGRRFLGRKSRKMAKTLKNRSTERRKALKMILCKR